MRQSDAFPLHSCVCKELVLSRSGPATPACASGVSSNRLAAVVGGDGEEDGRGLAARELATKHRNVAFSGAQLELRI